MLKLYGSARSRAAIIQWYLEELGAQYEFVTLDLQGGENRQPPYLAINPFGKVPGILDGDFPLWESGAILLYLAQKHEQLPTSAQQQATIQQWVLFANATLGIGFFVESNRERELPRLLSGLEGVFSNRTFLLGEEFTVADVAVGSILAYATMMAPFDGTGYPHLMAYIQRIKDRPAFRKTIGGGG